MGRTSNFETPKIAYGNANGLIKEIDVPKNLKVNDMVIDRLTLQGKGPWWVAYPGAFSNDGRDWGTGSRALIIRSYKGNLDGVTQTNPSISFQVYQTYDEGKANLDFMLTPPENVAQFKAGDDIKFDVEWITVPRIVDDYYGPNEALKKHLVENPKSWKTVYREAIGNDLKVSVSGGQIVQNYPLIISAESQEVKVNIDGGVGIVPIRFDGLLTKDFSLYQILDGKEVKLDQAVHGNDFWQTDYDVKSNTFKVTFNLPLDGLAHSEWILKK
jgi:hypothetical protein